MRPWRFAMTALLIFGALAGIVVDRVRALSPANVQSESQDHSPLSPYWSYRVRRWETLIVQEAQRRALDPDFLASLVWQESRGDASAVGPVGAVGLMQVMPREAGFSWRPSQETLLDPSVNLFWGTRTLATVVRQGKGDIFNALAAYNGGWDKTRSRGPQGFATNILRDYAAAVAEDHGVAERWTAFFGVQDGIIRGPIWVVDASRVDVYFYGHTNRVPDGTVLIPNRPATETVARCVDQEMGEIYDVGLWIYAEEQGFWVGHDDFDVTPFGEAPAEVTATPMPATPTPAARVTRTPKATQTVKPTPTVLATPTPLPLAIPAEVPTDRITPTPTSLSVAKPTPVLTMTVVDAVVLEGGADLRPGATRWWNPTETLPAGTRLELLGADSQWPDWVYVRTLDKALSGWVQIEYLRVQRSLRGLPRVTPMPTLTPTATATPSPTPTPTVACFGGPFFAEAWAMEKHNTPDGWMATIYARGHGGDCAYTYAWNDPSDIKGGPTHKAIMFDVTSEKRMGTIVGTVLVTSGEETVEVGIYIYPPDND